MRAKLQVIFPGMTILLLIVAISATSGIAGCGQAQRNVPFQDVVQGTDSAYGAEGAPAPTAVVRVIADETSLRAFGSEFIPNAQGSLTGIDLNQEFIVATLMGSKPTAGYSIMVSSISQKNTDVFVQVAQVQPAPGAVLAQMITSPYDVVRIKRTDVNPGGSLTFHMIGIDGQTLAESQANI